jgi:hypothetical protein
MNLVVGHAYSDSTTEGSIMDAHFNEYLAAVAGMAEVYGAWNDDPHPLPGDAQTSEPAEQLTAAA